MFCICMWALILLTTVFTCDVLGKQLCRLLLVKWHLDRSVHSIPWRSSGLRQWCEVCIQGLYTSYSQVLHTVEMCLSVQVSWVLKCFYSDATHYCSNEVKCCIFYCMRLYGQALKEFFRKPSTGLVDFHRLWLSHKLWLLPGVLVRASNQGQTDLLVQIRTEPFDLPAQHPVYENKDPLC